MVILGGVDWVIIGLFFAISMGIGWYAYQKTNDDVASYFLSGRNMPWWLLGISMVATTFSADTPNLVTDIVRNSGVSGNWVWWSYLLTGMLTVFVYAKLWRRSGITTDMEFYEFRYSGWPAVFLRGFRALYLGVLFNVLVMATVCLAGIKIGGVILGYNPISSLVIIAIITVFYTALGGLKGILLTDFFQFFLAMLGTIWAAWYLIQLPTVGGLANLWSHPAVLSKRAMLPALGTDEFIYLFILPLTVQWWASYYPGAEPGGGGYVVQRMLSAKTENDATIATLLFNIMHYALRPWPWILIALASLVVFPDIASLKQAFPHIGSGIVEDDMAYPAMLSLLPEGLLGLLVASLLAALMSTLSTHLNWGASYIVHDVYKRFIHPGATQTREVWVGRISSALLMIISALIALYLNNAKEAFDLIVQIGAGTGLVYVLRWLWWRINGYTEIVAMIVSVIVAFIMTIPIFDYWSSAVKLLLGVSITTLCWLVATFLTRPTDSEVLVNFYTKIRPYSMGWKPLVRLANLDTSYERIGQSMADFGRDVSYILVGCCLVFSILFGLGYGLYGEYMRAVIACILAFISGAYLYGQRSKFLT